MSTLATTAATSTRTPWTVHVLGLVTLLLAAVTSYGAVYFTFYFENPDPGAGSWVFVTVFLCLNLVAGTSALGLWRGRRLAWQVLLGYALLGIAWCAVKLVFWSEAESLVFGAANVLGLGLLAAPRTRAHASR